MHRARGSLLRVLRAPRFFGEQLRCVASGSGGSATRRVITVPELCTTERFASLLDMQLEALLEKASDLGETLSPRKPLSRELLELLGMECSVEVQVNSVDAERRSRSRATQGSVTCFHPPAHRFPARRDCCSGCLRRWRSARCSLSARQWLR